MFKLKRRPITVASRMAGNLVLLSLFTLSLVHVLGILPDPKRADLKRKAIITETLAITSSLLVQHREDEILKKNLTAILERNTDVLSACVRRMDGMVLHQVGDHKKHWYLDRNATSTPDNIYVPITCGSQQWGSVELSFKNDKTFLVTLRRHPLIPVGLLTICVNWCAYRWYLSRALNYLDPGKTVPMHVRATLDTFSEGVVVLNNEKQIVLANDKFKAQLDKSDDELLGKDISQLPWQTGSDDSTVPCWNGDDETSKGMKIGLKLKQEHRTYLVNSSAILASDGQRRGTIVSFDDITPMEEKRKELSKMLAELQSSRDELSLRNKELKHLATRDPLTGCLNRRTFFEIFDKQWKTAERNQESLSCFMVDVDHFKSVNDNHGHSVGDEVLRVVAQAIEKNARDSDVVCRYGGEEFCVLLSQTSTDEAWDIAERLRCAIEKLHFNNLSVTASLGVSSTGLGAVGPQELIDQADKCLYAAKRGGRNQVVRWDKVSEVVTQEQVDVCDRDHLPIDPEQASSIPYPAVASLLSALAYRDAATASHSTRVAEYCVATARGLLSVKDTYVLEVGALLHDIGKIGVPDAILLKPGPLTREEWVTMEIHDRIGAEIVGSSFSNPHLLNIVKMHHAKFGGSPSTSPLPAGQDIPIGARIVAIADAYDAMVSDRVYRKGRSPERAFEELRRCAGTQFDPQLVERFITVMQDYRPINVPVESRQLALQIGLQIERLAEAIDDRDSASIKALAVRLEATAARGGITQIESVAAEIRMTASDDSDLVSLLQLVDQLMTLCRSAQQIHAHTSIGSEPGCQIDQA
jgi:diguanylate cyclase (GGDEF)-like protein/putative nucleotidyltransferase with HDIG domain/PAS domain S-box-containing protein